VEKNSKNQESNGASEEAAPKAKKRAKPATKAGASKPKKTPAKTAAKKTTKAAPKRKGYEPSDEEIRLRAYFIAERRVQMRLEGDPANDWLEARQQLLEEAEQRRIASTVSI
jgi:hypothetical protein